MNNRTNRWADAGSYAAPAVEILEMSTEQAFLSASTDSAIKGNPEGYQFEELTNW